MDDVKTLFAERTALMEQALSNKVADRIPIVSNVASWKYYYAGRTPLEGLNNPEINMDVFRKFFTDFYMDGVLGVRAGRLLPKRTFDLIGGGTYTYNDLGLPITRPHSVTMMEASEYPELIDDPYTFLREKVFPRRYTLMAREDEGKYDDMIQVLKDQDELFARNAREDKIAIDEFGLPFLRLASIYNPVDYILDYLRDFTEITKDIRRCPDMVRDAGMALVAISMDHLGKPTPVPGKGVMTPMHLPPFIRAKDFEKVYWPSWKVVADNISEMGLHNICAFEKSFAHLYDMFNDLPTGITGILEGDMPWDVKPRCPNVGLIGGIPNSILMYESKEYCIDYAKMLIDKMHGVPGFMASTTVGMMTGADGKAENFMAVCDYFKEHGDE